MRERLAKAKQELIQALCEQQLVAGSQTIARKLHRHGELRQLQPNEFLIKQGCDSCDVFFIIDGEVTILINGREIGVLRGKRQHVGEMAGLDSSRRSACVKAIKPTTVLCLRREHFVAIADKHPAVWRALSVQLAERLRERSKFVRQPNIVPEVFIGSSGESLPVVAALEQRINEDARVVCKPWTDPTIFAPSETTIESLVKASQNADLAVLVFGPDDTLISRGKKFKAARDNVLIELGLFIGAIGRPRTLLVCPRVNDLKIPSDLLGVTPLKFEVPNGKPKISSVKALGTTIRDLALRLGPK